MEIGSKAQPGVDSIRQWSKTSSSDGNLEFSQLLSNGSQEQRGMQVSATPGFGQTSGLHWRTGDKFSGTLTPYEKDRAAPSSDAVLYDISDNGNGGLSFQRVDNTVKQSEQDDAQSLGELGEKSTSEAIGSKALLAADDSTPALSATVAHPRAGGGIDSAPALPPR